MDASILLIGSSDFLDMALERIRNLLPCTLEAASNPAEAMPLIQAQQPDVAILQGNQPGGLELCQQLKGQPKLAWIYCLVLDLPVQKLPEVWIDHTWELEGRAESLDSGADAYLWLPRHQPDGSPLDREELRQQDQVLRSQILAGVRMVRTHRELMRTNDILSAIALSDPLTELNNRRALDWELPRQVQNARHREEPLSLLMLDIDYFKSINDNYGHGIGDRALQLVSSRLRHNLRFRDTLFRYGGEEFVIILSGTDHPESLLVGRRLCRQIAEQPFAVDAELELTITISAGVATLRPNDDPKGNSLLKRADTNLLRAKASGRNRVISNTEGGDTLNNNSSDISPKTGETAKG